MTQKSLTQKTLTQNLTIESTVWRNFFSLAVNRKVTYKEKNKILQSLPALSSLQDKRKCVHTHAHTHIYIIYIYILHIPLPNSVFQRTNKMPNNYRISLRGEMNAYIYIYIYIYYTHVHTHTHPWGAASRAVEKHPRPPRDGIGSDTIYIYFLLYIYQIYF